MWMSNNYPSRSTNDNCGNTYSPIAIIVVPLLFKKHDYINTIEFEHPKHKEVVFTVEFYLQKNKLFDTFNGKICD